MKFDVVQLESTGIDVIDGDRGKNYPHQNELLSTGFCLFLSAKNVTKSGFSFSETQFISRRKDALLNNGRLCRGDIVITTRGTVGNVALYSPQVPYENIRINSGMLIIRCANNISNQYLYQVLRSEWFQKQIMAVQSGSAQPQLPKSHFLKMNIPLPPLPIQEKIASILQLIDDKITTNNSINDNLEQQAQALFKSWFVDFDPFGGNRPIDWITGIVDDLGAEIICGKTPSTKKKEYYGGNTPFITIPDMHGCVYNVSTERYLSAAGVASQPKKTLPHNTVCISCIGTAGLVTLVSEKSQSNQQINSIIPKEGISAYYIYLLMQTLSETINKLGQSGSTIVNLNKTQFGKIPVTIPSEQVLCNFDTLCKPLFEMILSNQKENIKLANLRDTLLPKLMSGELDVSEIEI